MEPSADAVRSRALPVVALFVGTLILLVLLGALFDEDVQTVGARELVDRKEDARTFLAADVVVVVVYAVLLPLAIRRFDRVAGLPRWIALGSLLLCVAGVLDAVENGLLLSATGSVAEGRVDAAHALAVPKIALWVAGAVAALFAAVRALRTVRGAGPPPA